MTAIAATHPSPQEETIPIEALPDGWKSAQVTFLKQGKKHTKVQIIDMRTNPPTQYWHDPMYVISCKCAVLALIIPFFLIGNLVFRGVRIPVLVLGTLIRSSYQLLHQRTAESLQKLFVDWTWEAPAALVQGICDFVKAPFCALDMWLCAIYGIFNPLEGRILVSRAERRWRGSDRTHDATRFKDMNRFFTELFTDRHSKNCHFIAYCFQPIGPVNAPHVIKVEYLDPKKTPEIKVQKTLKTDSSLEES